MRQENKSGISSFAILCGLIVGFCLISSSSAFAPSTLTFKNHKFYFNNTSVFKIVACQIHYSRIPVEYWEHRINMTKAMGCNSLSVYVMWNFHEITPGRFDFQTENKNLAHFLYLAQQQEMYVLLRPGPYVCAEWDFGGLPYWLLQDPKMQLRSEYQGYVTAYQQYINEVANIIEPFQINYGGPIILLQIENQFGYWGQDNSYPINLLRNWMFTGKIVVNFYTADPSQGVKIGGIEGLAVGLNPGTTQTAWDRAQSAFPDSTWFSAETYSGWLTHWGQKFAGKTTTAFEAELKYLCEEGGNGWKSFSIYMAHGGTNFGFTAGANFDLDGKGTFQPDITSYDYDAPINEAGNTTNKYNYIRSVLNGCRSGKSYPVPKPLPAMTVAEFQPTLWASIWENLPTPITSYKTRTMQDLDQPHGFVLYSAQIASSGKTLDRRMTIQELHDFANIYTNGNYVGSLDRRLNEYTMNLTSTTNQLDILVEAMGHLNFSPQMNFDRQGITDRVFIDDNEVFNWKIYSLPFDSDYIYNLRSIFDPQQIQEGLFFRANINLADTQDTYFDMSRWSQGFLWVNGRNLGRFWSVGPQFRLYCPGVWLKKGLNEIIVFDMHQITPEFISGVTSLT